MPVSPSRTPRAVPALVAALATALLLGSSPLAVRAEETPAPSATAAPTPTPSDPPAPTPAPTPTDSPPPAPVVPPGPVFMPGPIPVAGTITLYGRGYGHGVGMSQWGARGRALAGQDAATILAHYYQATTFATIDPSAPIRVLLVSNFSPTPDRPARIVGLNGPWTIDGLGALFPPAAALTLSPRPGSWQASVAAADGAVISRPSPELRGSSDRAPDGTPYDAASPSASWRTATYSIESFSAIMAANPRTAVGLVTAIAFTRPGISGRVVRVTLYGMAGVKTVSGPLFQAVFNAHRPPRHPALRSTLIDLMPIP